MPFVKIVHHCHVRGKPVIEGDVVEVDEKDLRQLTVFTNRAVEVEPPKKTIKADGVQGGGGPKPENRESDLESKVTKRGRPKSSK